jgi:hypothetical protein
MKIVGLIYFNDSAYLKERIFAWLPVFDIDGKIFIRNKNNELRRSSVADYAVSGGRLYHDVYFIRF